MCNFKTNLFEQIYIRAVLNFCPETKGGWPFFASSKLKHKLLFCYHFAITIIHIHKFRYSATDYNTAGERGSYFVNDQTLLQSNLLPFCFCFIYSGFCIHSLKTAGILLRLEVIFSKECIISELPRIKDHFQNGSFFPAFSIVEGVKIGQKQSMYNRRQ